MADTYYHGTKMTSSVDSTATVTIVETSPVGVIVSGDAADAAMFPLEKAVQISAFDADTYAKCGSTGTFKSVLKSLAAQGYAPTTTIVRVPELEADLESNVLNALDILDDAAAEGTHTIKLLGAPGLETVAIANKMGALCDDLGGFSYAAIRSAETMSDAILARSSYGSKNTMMLWPAEVAEAGEVIHTAALALGLRAVIDEDKGIAKTLSNISMAGIDDIGVPMNYRGEQSIANQLNKNDITTIIRKNGFRFWGQRTASSEPMFTYESDVRVAHYVDAQFEGLMDGKMDSITTSEQLEDAVEEGQQLLDDLARGDDAVIINGECWLDSSENTEAVLSEGGVKFNYKFGVAKPLEQPSFDGLITNEYLLEVLPSFSETSPTTQV